MGAELTAVPTGSGLAVFGDAGAVDEFVGGLTSVAPRSSSVKRTALDVAQLASVVGVGRATDGQFVKLTPETMDRLRELGQTLEAGETYAGVVRDDGGSILSHMTFTVADFDPQRALALQQWATTAALQAAIEEVAEAVNRVEGKLDVLSDLVRSQRVGHAIGDHRFLGPLVERVEAGERLSDDDWSTVQHLGADITRDIEALRQFVRARLADEESRRSTRSRADRLQTLVDSHLDEILGALLLCEHNLMMWHRVKLARVGGGRDQAAVSVERARAALDAHRVDDQRLVTALEEEIDALTEARGLEGLAVVSRGQLVEYAAMLNATVDWFADQRTLDVTDTEVALPGFRESLSTAKEAALDTTRVAKEKVAGRIRRSAADEGSDAAGTALEAGPSDELG